MRRSDAYAFLAKELEQWRSVVPEHLTAAIDRPVVARYAEIAGERVLIETRVTWVDSSREAVLIEAEASGPSHWQTERVVERVRVSLPKS
jgi:hypothetical protein